ncbi:MAG: tRNA lysidine(34) synthetase TilS [Opitutales bacterium]|nr:tRNA lysidine(34) synthetase TilS [Opitutales bacterium]MCH8539855.1 tRNA lysidine(34) synthetase TilS [Opitutales bacterium]
MQHRSLEWATVAEHLAERFPRGTLDPAGVPPEDLLDRGPLLVSVSGGGDSVGLWLLLWAHFPVWRSRLEILTFDHCTRSGESTRDVEWVVEFGQAFGCKVHCGQADRCGEGLNENDLRQMRRDFQKKMLRMRGAQHLFTGHHREDVLESLLIRLCRGSGSEGASGPRPRQSWDQNWIWRPLLSIEGSSLQGEMRKLNIPFCEDRTNFEGEAFRNRLRHQVIPALREVSPYAPTQGAARMRRLLEEDATALKDWASQWLAKQAGESLSRVEVYALPRALQRRVLGAWLGSFDQKGEAGLMDQILDALAAGTEASFTIAAETLLNLTAEKIFLDSGQQKQPEPSRPVALPLVPNGTVYFPGGQALRAGPITPKSSETWPLVRSADASMEAWVDVSSLVERNSWDLRVGFRHPGQRFQPLGAPGSKKLAEQFIDRKIPRGERQALPVVSESTRTVWWVPGFPPSEKAAISEGTEYLLHLTYFSISSG